MLMVIAGKCFWQRVDLWHLMNDDSDETQMSAEMTFKIICIQEAVYAEDNVRSTSD